MRVALLQSASSGAASKKKKRAVLVVEHNPRENLGVLREGVCRQGGGLRVRCRSLLEMASLYFTYTRRCRQTPQTWQRLFHASSAPAPPPSHSGLILRILLLKLKSIKKFCICAAVILHSVRECKPSLIPQQPCPPLSTFTSLIFQPL